MRQPGSNVSPIAHLSAGSTGTEIVQPLENNFPQVKEFFFHVWAICKKKKKGIKRDIESNLILRIVSECKQLTIYPFHSITTRESMLFSSPNSTPVFLHTPGRGGTAHRSIKGSRPVLHSG